MARKRIVCKSGREEPMTRLDVLAYTFTPSMQEARQHLCEFKVSLGIVSSNSQCYIERACLKIQQNRTKNQ